MVEKIKPKPLVGRPMVSIVVACYNYGRFLPAAMSSALDQPEVDLEIIIADNGSTDNSLEIAQKLADSDPRIRIHTQSQNVNNLRNFNEGLQMVTGKYSQVLCADDMLTPGSIARAVAVMEERPDVVFTFGRCPTFDTEIPRLRTTSRSWSIWDGREWTSTLYRSGLNIIHHPEVLMRTSTLRAIGGYNPNYALTSDMLLWLQAAARGNVARINGPDQALYRVHGANLHLKINASGWLNDLKGRQAVFDSLPELDPIARVDPDDVLASRRALATRAVQYACDAFESSDPKQQELAVSYADYAREIWPAIEKTRGWQEVEARKHGGAMPRWWTYVARVQRKARSIAWVR